MKLKHTLSLLSLATCAALSTSAFAQTVTFQGQITDAICTTVVAGTNNVVTLLPRSAADFPNVGDSNGVTDFNVVLSGCNPDDKTYRINFSNGAADGNGYLPNLTGTSAGYAFELLNSAGTGRIEVTTTAATTSGPYDADDAGVLAVGGNATLPYKVRYVRTDTDSSGNPVTRNNGTVIATATMTVQYQ